MCESEQTVCAFTFLINEGLTHPSFVQKGIHMIRLANLHTPHVTTVAHSVLDLFRVNSLHENMQCATPAPEVIYRQGTASKTQSPFISPADWDALFVAVQTRLEICVGDISHQAPVLPLQDQKSMPNKAVVECVEALRLLHTSLMIERQSLQRN